MGKKTVKFNVSNIDKLPKDKPVLYKIKTNAGTTNYVGVAKRGRIQERLKEHLNSEEIKGIKVEIEQMPSIAEAKEKETRIIKRTKPKYNKQGNEDN
ncbi:MAG: hypothetical protein HN921_17980 [Bacteroidetes bacterium]|jgi:excinuclease UvrABC nuclease subunit|nr:hypothetical protein [Candidatus Cloacimonadota bacterium]MBT7041725.1 hypothetical protein [Bacteroidota bacterium]